MNRILIALLLIAALVMASCAGVKFDQDDPAYLNKQFASLPATVVNSRIVLDEEGSTLTGFPLTLGELVYFMVTSRPITPNSWISAEVTHNDDGATIVFRQYNRGNLALVNTLDLAYVDATDLMSVEKITWDDRLNDDADVELVTLEEKAGYALLVFTFLIIQ